ncbi:MAG: FtsW/RodA/SpoVE family cell cycle protein [Candidatus Sumerlaeia bacterium]
MMQDSSNKIQTWLMQFDYLLLLFVLLATALGIIVMHGGTSNVGGLSQYVPRQIQWWKVSIVIFFMAVLFPYRWLRYLGWPLYLFSILLLLIVWLSAKDKLNLGFIDAVRAGGADSWLRINLGARSFQFQPSELTKISTVIILASWLAWRRQKLTNVWECIVPGAVALIPFVLIAIQPDVGTAAIFLPLPFLLLFVAGLRWKIVGTTIVLGLLLAVSGTIYFLQADEAPFLRKYHLRRIQVFLEPIVQPFKLPGVEEILYGTGPADNGAPQDEKKADDWNIRQAEMALGSGRLFGKGWGKGTQARYRFLPEHHTDFIFCSLGEQFGLAGCLGLILLYVLIGWRVFHIAIETRNFFGKYMVVGLMSIIFIHIFLNIGMMVRLLPVAGLPLPLMSYGGTFLAANYLMFGLIVNVGMRRDPRDFQQQT